MTADEVTRLALQPLDRRCLALTGSFETGCLPPACFGCAAGDFDGQGISYSALQWNLGQGTLQPLLMEMNTAHAEIMGRVFGNEYAQLRQVLAMAPAAQMSWARSVQTPRHVLHEPWNGHFRALGESAEFQAVAAKCAAELFDGALELCRTFELQSQRAAALLFDIKVQNGGIGPATRALIEQDFDSLQSEGITNSSEPARMRAIANRIADASAARWRETVRSRKLTIAIGTGSVNRIRYDLAAQFALTLAPWNGA